MNAEFSRFLLEDERAACMKNPQLDFSVLESPTLLLPIVRIRDVTRLDEVFRGRLGVSDDLQSLTLVGGGIAQLLSFWVARGSVTGPAEHSFERSIRDAIVGELATSSSVVVLSASPTDLGLLSRLPGLRAEVTPAVSHFVAEIGDAKSIQDFVAAQPASVRKVWRRDMRDSMRAALSSSVEDLTADACAEAAPFFAATSHRNGDSGSPLTAEWRLASRLHRPGEHLMILIRAGDVLVANVAVTVGPDHLDAHSVGVAPDSPVRQEAYQALYRICIEMAIERGLRFVTFGHGNPHPKLTRGCSEVSRIRLEYRLM